MINKIKNLSANEWLGVSGLISGMLYAFMSVEILVVVSILFILYAALCMIKDCNKDSVIYSIFFSLSSLLLASIQTDISKVYILIVFAMYLLTLFKIAWNELTT